MTNNQVRYLSFVFIAVGFISSGLFIDNFFSSIVLMGIGGYFGGWAFSEYQSLKD